MQSKGKIISNSVQNLPYPPPPLMDVKSLLYPSLPRYFEETKRCLKTSKHAMRTVDVQCSVLHLIFHVFRNAHLRRQRCCSKVFFFNKMTELSKNVSFVCLERQHVHRCGGRDSNTKCANKVD